MYMYAIMYLYIQFVVSWAQLAMRQRRYSVVDSLIFAGAFVLANVHVYALAKVCDNLLNEEFDKIWKENMPYRKLWCMRLLLVERFYVPNKYVHY